MEEIKGRADTINAIVETKVSKTFAMRPETFLNNDNQHCYKQ